MPGAFSECSGFARASRVHHDYRPAPLYHDVRFWRTHVVPRSKSGFGGNTSAMDPIRQDITAVLEECYSRGMQLPYLFVAVSLDGRVMGVRFTEAEDGEGLDAQPIAGNP